MKYGWNEFNSKPNEKSMMRLDLSGNFIGREIMNEFHHNIKGSYGNYYKRNSKLFKKKMKVARFSF